MAEEIWDIKDNDILNAISCHTTLWDKPSRIDLILFVADKIRWDQRGEPPYIEKVQKGLEISLEHGAWEYIKYLLDNKENLRVIHPWLLDAYRFLTNWITREDNKV
jgi:HD superfamily phosphohydrolase YqeK